MTRPQMGLMPDIQSANFTGDFITPPVVDTDTGEVHYPDEANAREALAKAKPKRKRKKTTE